MARIPALAFLLLTGIAPGYAQSTFHGDVARTGVYASSGPVNPPSVQWTFRAAGPVVTSPAIANGVLYIGSLSGHLYAIDQQTGQEKWNFKSRMPIASSAAVAGGTVYFVSSAGSLAAIDAATGQPRWVFAHEYERKFEARGLHGYPPAAQTIADAWDVFTSSPAVANGKVYFGSGDGNVYAVDAGTGVLQWKFATKDVVHASPAVANGVVYVGSWDGNFYALDAETGAAEMGVRRRTGPGHPQPGRIPVVAGRGGRHGLRWMSRRARVRARCRDRTQEMGLPDEQVVGERHARGARRDRLRRHVGQLKVHGAGCPHRPPALQLRCQAYVFSSAALAGGLAYFGSHNGKLYAVDVRTGAAAWEFQTEASRTDPLKVVNPDGSLDQAAFAPVFGDFQDMYIDFYRFVSVGGIMGSPAVDQGAVYVGSIDGFVYALR